VNNSNAREAAAPASQVAAVDEAKPTFVHAVLDAVPQLDNTRATSNVLTKLRRDGWQPDDVVRHLADSCDLRTASGGLVFTLLRGMYQLEPRRRHTQPPLVGAVYDSSDTTPLEAVSNGSAPMPAELKRWVAGQR
jgi:hypothetical protein